MKVYLDQTGKVRPWGNICWIEKDDMLMVWKLDRLGRSLQDLIQIVNDLAGRGVGFASLSWNPWSWTSIDLVYSRFWPSNYWDVKQICCGHQAVQFNLLRKALISFLKRAVGKIKWSLILGCVHALEPRDRRDMRNRTHRGSTFWTARWKISILEVNQRNRTINQMTTNQFKTAINLTKKPKSLRIKAL